MSFTVTATGTGAVQAEMVMTLKVLTGAASTQNGAAAHASGSGLSPPSVAVTPDASGSLVFGAAVIFPGPSVFTPLASTTYYTNADNPIPEAFASFVSSSVTSASVPVTLGGSAPTGGTAGGIAVAEILASGTLAPDASSPADNGLVDATSATTAAFDPPAGALLVLMLASNGSAGVTGFTITDTSGLSLTWTALSQADNSSEGYAAVWAARMPGAAGRAVSLAVTPALVAARRAAHVSAPHLTVSPSLTAGTTNRPAPRMFTLPGAALPGAAVPGVMEPGLPKSPVVTSAPAVVLTLGVPYFQWAAGTPYLS